MYASFNIPFFTFGGLQWWEDSLFRNGWKIQKNVWSKNCRLLDPFNIRRARGSFNYCKEQLNLIFKEWELDDDDNEQVIIMIHGLGRTPFMFNKLSRFLKDYKYSLCTFNYPSCHYNIQSSTEALNAFLNNLPPYKQVSFISHSLGGILLRNLLKLPDLKWKNKAKLDKIIQLAPPNQGSEFAQMLIKFKIFNYILGTALTELTHKKMKNFPAFPEKTFFGIIAGAFNYDKGINPFLKEDNDGILKVSETILIGAKDFHTLASYHSFIAANKNCFEPILSFLRTGRFNKSSNRTPNRKIEIY